MSACARPNSVCTTVIGGAIALWAPITALPQCQARLLGVVAPAGGAGQLVGPEPRDQRLELRVDRSHLVVVDGGADGRVHEVAHGVGQRSLERLPTIDLCSGQVLVDETAHDLLCLAIDSSTTWLTREPTGQPA